MTNKLIAKLGNKEFEIKEFEIKGFDADKLEQTQKVILGGEEYFLEKAENNGSELTLVLNKEYCTCTIDSIRALEL